MMYYLTMTMMCGLPRGSPVVWCEVWQEAGSSIKGGRGITRRKESWDA